MAKSYIIVKEGLLQERIFPIQRRLTIGRGKENDLTLSDPTISKRHAALFVKEGLPMVEDLKSSNGIYVNGERVTRAVLANGDTLRLGSVALCYVEQEEGEDIDPVAQTQELSQTALAVEAPAAQRSARSKRVMQALLKTPIFSDLNEEQMAQVSQGAHLLLFDPGKTIIRQGDRGRSLYIVLDGKVKVLTYDHQGREIALAYLQENKFFGEMSFLTGQPRSATVQAVEESLVCELRPAPIEHLISKLPKVRGTLEEYYRKRLNELEEKKRAAGAVERRRHPRFNIRVPVSFSISSSGK
ncbi:MAG: cyclic nucleotide-binding domain-containing protein [Syntrophobacteria bacterium]